MGSYEEARKIKKVVRVLKSAGLYPSQYFQVPIPIVLDLWYYDCASQYTPTTCKKYANTVRWFKQSEFADAKLFFPKLPSVATLDKLATATRNSKSPPYALAKRVLFNATKHYYQKLERYNESN